MEQAREPQTFNQGDLLIHALARFEGAGFKAAITTSRSVMAPWAVLTLLLPTFRHFQEAGAKMVGHWPTDDYQHSGSKVSSPHFKVAVYPLMHSWIV